MNKKCLTNPKEGETKPQCKKKMFLIIGLLKCGFRVMASCRVKKIHEMSSISFNMGCCMCGQGLPAWLENSTYCMNHLNSTLYSSLQDVDLQTRIYLWFMHDGAPPHSLLAVWEFLNGVFLKQWIGRGDPTACLAPSPDLNPSALYVWEHLKSTVCVTEISDGHDLQHRTQNGSEIIWMTSGIFQWVRQSLSRRAMSCI